MRSKRGYIWKIVLIVVAVVFFLIGIPLIINEAYKFNSGYITLWEASDVLSYYGAVLGGGSTLIALLATISFTRRQLKRERYLENEQGKWNRVDSIISQALTNISPLRMRSEEIISTPMGYVQQRIRNLQSYAITARTSLDTIKGYIYPQDYDRIAPLISKIVSATDTYCAIESKLETEYAKLLRVAIQNSGTIPDEIFSATLNTTNRIAEEIPLVYNGSYQKLINLKRDIFQKIYAEIEVEAEEILHPFRKLSKCRKDNRA